MRPNVADWFARQTSIAADWPMDTLLAQKVAQHTSIAVVLPALNEAETVGHIVESVRENLASPAAPLVDELVVLDSRSTDNTSAVAAAAGARVIHMDDVFPELPTVTGKGEAMWRALAATRSDIVVFIDADLHSFSPEYVTGLVGPLLANAHVQLVKALYERPLVEGDTVIPAGGGRVTELMARPMLTLNWPELAGVVQPLAGEYAARRSLLEQLPFPCGYGIEFALLVDTYRLYGLDALAQVDLGIRIHRHHDERRLGRMASEVMQTAFARLQNPATAPEYTPWWTQPTAVGTNLHQFSRAEHGFEVETYEISGLERPPIVTIPEYIRRQRFG